MLVYGGGRIYGAQIAIEAGDFLQPNRHSNWRVPTQPAHAALLLLCLLRLQPSLEKAPLVQLASQTDESHACSNRQ